MVLVTDLAIFLTMSTILFCKRKNWERWSPLEWGKMSVFQNMFYCFSHGTWHQYFIRNVTFSNQESFFENSLEILISKFHVEKLILLSKWLSNASSWYLRIASSYFALFLPSYLQWNRSFYRSLKLLKLLQRFRMQLFDKQLGFQHTWVFMKWLWK